MNCELCQAPPGRCQCAANEPVAMQADEGLTDRDLVVVGQGIAVARMAVDLMTRGVYRTKQRAVQDAAQILGMANRLVREVDEGGRE